MQNGIEITIWKSICMHAHSDMMLHDDTVGPQDQYICVCHDCRGFVCVRARVRV